MSWYPRNDILIKGSQAESRVKIMAIQGSARNKDNCPDKFGKSRTLLSYAVSSLPSWVSVDFFDLSVSSHDPIVQPCKACVSTSAFHCHYECSCYFKGDKDRPDLLHEKDFYKRMEEADGFLLVAPVNWYNVPTQVKAAFDRLVCVSKTMTQEQAKQLMGEDIKDAEKTRALEQSNDYNHLLKNHYQDKTAAFFIHGDDGAADYKEYAKNPERKETLEPKPETLYNTGSKISEAQFDRNAKSSILNIVWQCRYSGIEVPEELVVGMRCGAGYPYSTNDDMYKYNKPLFNNVSKLAQKLIDKIDKKKKKKKVNES